MHPTQRYEAALMLLAFWLIWGLQTHQRAAGWLFGLYLLLAGIERFLVEFLRAKDNRFLGPSTIAQGMSLVIALLGALMLARWSRPDAHTAPDDPAVLRAEIRA